MVVCNLHKRALISTEVLDRPNIDLDAWNILCCGEIARVKNHGILQVLYRPDIWMDEGQKVDSNAYLFSRSYLELCNTLEMFETKVCTVI